MEKIIKTNPRIKDATLFLEYWKKRSFDTALIYSKKNFNIKGNPEKMYNFDIVDIV